MAKEVKTVEIVEAAKDVTSEVTRKVGVMTKLSRAVGKVSFEVSKNAPLILTAAGIVGVGATAYTAYKSRAKIETILDDVETRQKLQEKLGELEAKDAEGEISSLGEQTALEDLRKENAERPFEMKRSELVLRLTGAMALPIFLGVASASAIGASYVIQNRRLVGMATALAASAAERKLFKDRFVKKYSEEEYNKIETEEEQEVITTDAKGKEKKEVKKVRATKFNNLNGRWFADSNDYYADDHQYNLTNLRNVKSQIENRLFEAGYISYNRVMDLLGFDRIKGGAELGWNTASGFDMNFQTTNFEEGDQLTPQIYIRWTHPISIYHDVEYTGRYSEEG